MKLSKFCWMSVLIAVICSCTKPMDEKITDENFSRIMEDIRRKGTEEEFQKAQAVAALADMAALAGKSKMDVLRGKSFNEIVANMQMNAQKAAEERAQQDLKKLQVAKEEKEKSEALAKILTVTQIVKGRTESRYKFQQRVNLELTFKNQSDQDIDAFQATIYIYDKLNNLLAKKGVKSTQVLKAGKEDRRMWEFEVMDFDSKMPEVYETDGRDLKFSIEPTNVLFVGANTAH